MINICGKVHIFILNDNNNNSINNNSNNNTYIDSVIPQKYMVFHIYIYTHVCIYVCTCIYICIGFACVTPQEYIC